MDDPAHVVLDRVTGATVHHGLHRPLVVCIDGPSGSGKSSLTEAVARAATDRGLRTSVVQSDELLDGWGGLEAMPDALVSQVLSRLGERRVLQHRRYDWHSRHFSTPRRLDVADLYLVEGVGTGDRRLAPWTDLLVWVDADASLRRERALARDGDDYAPWFAAWARQEQTHHARERTHERADLVVMT
jgi:uridine kinase